MSEVIVHGREWPRKKEAWYGKQIKCHRCNCVFKVAKETSFDIAEDVSKGVYLISHIRCPECGVTSNKLRWRD